MRDLYPSTSKYANRGYGNVSAEQGKPDPTAAPPGSSDKLAELTRRASLGLALHVEGDKGDYEDPADHAKARVEMTEGPEAGGIVRKRRYRSQGPRFAGVGEHSARAARQRTYTTG